MIENHVDLTETGRERGGGVGGRRGERGEGGVGGWGGVRREREGGGESRGREREGGGGGGSSVRSIISSEQPGTPREHLENRDLPQTPHTEHQEKPERNPWQRVGYVLCFGKFWSSS